MIYVLIGAAFWGWLNYQFVRYHTSQVDPVVAGLASLGIAMVAVLGVGQFAPEAVLVWISGAGAAALGASRRQVAAGTGAAGAAEDRGGPSAPGAGEASAPEEGGGDEQRRGPVGH